MNYFKIMLGLLVTKIGIEKVPNVTLFGNCDHFVVDGFGGMGDAVTCLHCGLSKYPEVFPGYAKARRNGRYIGESHPEYSKYRKMAADAYENRHLSQTDDSQLPK